MRSKKKLTELEKEKLLDQEEMIDFYYHDKESKTKILIHDKRKIKVALMELDEEERKSLNSELNKYKAQLKENELFKRKSINFEEKIKLWN